MIHLSWFIIHGIIHLWFILHDSWPMIVNACFHSIILVYDGYISLEIPVQYSYDALSTTRVDRENPGTFPCGTWSTNGVGALMTSKAVSMALCVAAGKMESTFLWRKQQGKFGKNGVGQAEHQQKMAMCCVNRIGWIGGKDWSETIDTFTWFLWGFPVTIFP